MAAKNPPPQTNHTCHLRPQCPERFGDRLRCCLRSYPDEHGERKWIQVQIEKEEKDERRGKVRDV